VGIITREGLMELIAVLSAMHNTYDEKNAEQDTARCNIMLYVSLEGASQQTQMFISENDLLFII